jgi:hypothetical protein
MMSAFMRRRLFMIGIGGGIVRDGRLWLRHGADLEAEGRRVEVREITVDRHSSYCYDYDGYDTGHQQASKQAGFGMKLHSAAAL